MSDHTVHRLQTSMPLKTAETIADEALKAGAAAKLLPLTVAVLDVGGNLVVLKRQDGSGNLRADVAIGKAWGALGMGISSRTIRDRLKERPGLPGRAGGGVRRPLYPGAGRRAGAQRSGRGGGSGRDQWRCFGQGRIRRHHRRA